MVRASPWFSWLFTSKGQNGRLTKMCSTNRRRAKRWSSLRLCWRTCDAISALRNPLISLDRGSLFCAINVNCVNGERSEAWYMICSIATRFLRHSPCVFALQEMDRWEVSEVEVPGCVCYDWDDWDDGTTAILCPGQRCQIRHSWENMRVVPRS